MLMKFFFREFHREKRKCRSKFGKSDVMYKKSWENFLFIPK